MEATMHRAFSAGFPARQKGATLVIALLILVLMLLPYVQRW